MTTYRIAVLPGDGIGPEVMDAALRVLERAQSVFQNLRLEFTLHEAGSEHYRRTGEALPPAVLDDCLAADAVFLAAIGLPDVRADDGTEIQPVMMVGLRRALQLYAAVRPIKLYPGVPSPLGDVSQGIDFVIVRENLEGLFSSFGGGFVVGDETAGDSLIITRRGTERIVRYAFRLAGQRHLEPNRRPPLVTCVDKANVFRSFAFWRKVFYEVADQFPQIAADAEYVDATSLLMVQRPHKYDVIVTENQFGDILSDLGAALVGGLGLAPSGEIGDEHALFQPSHGTAPDLAGQDLANPLATILSGAMMLDWLAAKHDDPAAAGAATCVEAAVQRVLVSGEVLPRDLGGTSGTQDVGQAVANNMQSPTDKPEAQNS